MARRSVWALVGALWLLAWLHTPPAHANGLQQAATEAALRDLALWVARVATNEGALKNRPEAALVWQTTRSNGKTTEKRSEWLAKHSPRVHGTRQCRGGNCLWTTNLTREVTLPVGLVLRQDVWDLRVAPLWRDTLIYVDWMVLGDRTSEDPCHVPPRTWGCEADRAGALAEGLYPIGCRGTSDDGFAFEKSCRRDGSWICDPRFEPATQSKDSLLVSLASR